MPSADPESTAAARCNSTRLDDTLLHGPVQITLNPHQLSGVAQLHVGLIRGIRSLVITKSPPSDSDTDWSNSSTTKLFARALFGIISNHYHLLNVALLGLFMVSDKLSRCRWRRNALLRAELLCPSPPVSGHRTLQIGNLSLWLPSPFAWLCWGRKQQQRLPCRNAWFRFVVVWLNIRISKLEFCLKVVRVDLPMDWEPDCQFVSTYVEVRVSFTAAAAFRDCSTAKQLWFCCPQTEFSPVTWLQKRLSPWWTPHRQHWVSVVLACVAGSWSNSSNFMGSVGLLVGSPLQAGQGSKKDLIFDCKTRTKILLTISLFD